MIQASYRSSKTGKFVTEKYAKRHPATTYLDTIKKKKPKPKTKSRPNNYPLDEFNEG